MTDAADPASPRRPPRGPRRRRPHATAWVLVLVLLLAALGGIAALALSERRLVLPDAATLRIETRVNAALRGSRLHLGAVSVGLSRDGTPRLWLEDVTLFDPAGGRLADLGRVGVAFDPGAALRGRVAPRALRMAGLQMTLQRDASGSFNFRSGGGQMAFDGVGAALDMLDAGLARAPFDRLQEVSLAQVAITLEDARTARVWQITDGRIDLTRAGDGDRDGDGAALSLNASIFNGTDTLAAIQASVRTQAADGRAVLQASVRDAQAADIAVQAPVLSVLSVLDAPLSASLRTELGRDGALASVAGTLQIGGGALRPRPSIPAVPFDGAKVYFTFDPVRGRLEIPQIALQSDSGRLAATGHADLADLGPGGWPRAVVAQLDITDLHLNPDTVLAAPLDFTAGHVDMRIRLAPFGIEFGQIVLMDGDMPLRAKGRVAARPDGWEVAMDLSARDLAFQRLLDLWPVGVGKGARKWSAANIKSGTLPRVEAAFRKAPASPKVALATSFTFEGAVVSPLGELPPITQAQGYGSLTGTVFSVTLDQGAMTPPGRGPVSLAGSTLTLADTTQRPGTGQFDIRSDGPLPSLLAVLDAKPLRLLTRSNRSPDLGTGRVQLRTALGVPFRRGVKPGDLTLDAAGTLSDFRSDSLLGKRVLTGDDLAVEVSTQSIGIAGQAALDGVAFDGRWRQALAGPDRGAGRVAGQVALSSAGLKTFGVSLPDGLLRGSGTGDIVLDLAPGQAPTFSLTSDLQGLALSVDAVGWSKPASATGDFAISGALGAAPRIDAISLEAAGLRAQGDLTLQGGRFASLDLDRVRLNGWLDAAVRIAARAPGQPPAIAVSGGVVDMRRATLGGAGGGGGSGGGAARGPVRLDLDRLVLTDTIALTAARVDLAPGRSLSGEFRARVNGGAPVAGRILGAANGASISVTSEDAGAVLRDAGLFARVEGGALRLVLNPTGAKGSYDGSVMVSDIRLRDAPAAAELLSAISVVGLIEQLNQGGIPFDEVTADFRMAPDRITLYRSSAVGASMGVSMDGVYVPATRMLDMQGVVSPFYFVNSIGSFLTRRGEGLFGVNFTLKGPATAPSVGVNPLSILAPGAFREIFRRAPPTRPASR